MNTTDRLDAAISDALARLAVAKDQHDALQAEAQQLNEDFQVQAKRLNQEGVEAERRILGIEGELRALEALKRVD